ncbi:MAG: hypothetical protein JXR42_03875 [Gammaproteobacteria bacterium]|nr:hypothetical protein [Gammaproteobacteria bacterium]
MAASKFNNKYTNREKILDFFDDSMVKPVAWVSNAGIIPLSKHIGELRCEAVELSANVPALWNRSHTLGFVAYTWDNRLSFDLMYTRPTITVESAKKLQKLVLDIL